MVRYAITEGLADTADGAARLLASVRRWAAEGVEYVQLRERGLEGGALLELASAVAAIVREGDGRTKLLVNGRVDIAVAAGADGVHLTARPGELTPKQVRRVFAAAGVGEPVVSVACHSVAAVTRAADAGADLVLFGPVFEKRVDGVLVVEGVGLDALAEACRAAGGTPVMALGGVTAQSTAACLAAGAAGVAGIRLFE